MNKCRLFTDDDNELTMLNEDPDDLTATVGDVPLEHVPNENVLPDMLDDIILFDCKLLSNDNDDSYFSTSPNSFFSYRDDLESFSRPLSPMLSQYEDCSIPSLGSDDSPLHNNSVNHFLDFERQYSSNEFYNLSSKPTLPPLILGHDTILPFVTNDFMCGSSSVESLWSSMSSSPTSNYSSSLCMDPNSSLAKLLTEDSACNYDGGSGAASKNNGGRFTNFDALIKRNTCQPEISVSAQRSASRGHSKFSLSHKVATLFQRSNSVNNSINTNGMKRRCSGNNMSRGSVTANGASVQYNHYQTKKDVKNWNKRSSIDTILGTKGNGLDIKGRTSNKSSKHNTKTIVTNKKIHESAEAMMVAAEQTNSVLMNLLISGCDLEAGYVCVNTSVKNRFKSPTSSSICDEYSTASYSSLICMGRK